MKKKSHISLASYLMNNMHNEDLIKHRKAFWIGSILPDCVPSFLTKRHTIEETFELLKKEIAKITKNYDPTLGITRYYCRHLGIITHYIADYFTYPHNSIFTGSMKEHIQYEFKLMDMFKEFLNSNETKDMRIHNNFFYTVDDICDFIKNMHQEYLKAIKKIKTDCMYILELCYHVVKTILQILEINIFENGEQQIA